MLLAVVLNAIQDFRNYVSPSAKDAIETAGCAIRRFRDLRDDCGFINEVKLQDAFCDLVQHGMSPFPSLLCYMPGN